MKVQRGNTLDCAPGSGYQVWIDLDDGIDDAELGLLCRNLDEEAARINIEN